MRVIGLLLVLAAVAGFYWLGGNRLDEAQVRDFYQRAEQAMLALDDETLCRMLAEDFEQTTVTRVESNEMRATMDKAGYCRSTAETTEQLRQLRDAMRGNSPMRYSQTVVSVTLAPDRRSADVEMRATLEMPGMRSSSRSRDTVVRERWRMYALRSNSVVWVGPAYR